MEAGYTYLGSVSQHAYGDHAKLSAGGWTLGLNGHFNPTQNWYISARGGAFYWKLHARLSGLDPMGMPLHASGSDQSLGWYAGVGTGYDINWHWSIGVNFDYYRIDRDSYGIGSKLLTVNAEYRF